MRLLAFLAAFILAVPVSAQRAASLPDFTELMKKSGPAVTALMIRGHGPTVWGAGLQQAYDRFEILEYLLRYQAHARR